MEYNQKPTHHLFYFSNFQNNLFSAFVLFKMKNSIFKIWDDLLKYKILDKFNIRRVISSLSLNKNNFPHLE
jgi:hypothetical protein